MLQPVLGIAAPQLKPQSSLHVSIVPISPISSDQPIQFEISINSKVTTSLLKLKISVPGDMQLIDGDLSWQGAINANETVVKTFTGIFSLQHNNIVSAVVSVKQEKAGHYSHRDSFQFGGNTRNKVAPQNRMNERVVNRGNKKVIEVKID